MNKILVIAGMHRSGTSVTANWLQTCGLHIGDRLIPGNYSNPKGHFEDIEISHFQREILATNGLTHLVFPRHIIQMQEKFYEKARALIQERQYHVQWGWKDPRTCLLLNFWKTLLPEMKVIAVFRHYSLVVASMIRRDRPRIFLPAALKKIIPYTCTWERYNQDILAFMQKYPQDTLLFEIDSLPEYSVRVIEYINQEWGFSLVPRPVTDVFEAELLRQNLSTFYKVACSLACPSVRHTCASLRHCQSHV